MDQQQMPTSEVLNLAADLIERRGWKVGSGWPRIGNESAPLCLEGGILAALGLHLEDFKKYEEVQACPGYQAVASHIDTNRQLYFWNDEPGRTAHQVIATLRAVAVIEAAREQQPAEVTR